MGTSTKITFKYTRDTDINGVKIRENIRDLRAICGKKIKKYTTDNTEIHGFKIHVLFIVFYIS